MGVKVASGFSGKVRLFDRMIAFNWKGLQCFRSETPNIHQTPSAAWDLIKQSLTILSTRWFTVLTEAERNLWDEYAGMLNSQAQEVSNRIGAGAGNIIRSRQKVMSGYNAYIGANLLTLSRGDAVFPRIHAPISVPAPTSPLNIGLSYDPATGTATVTWSDPDIAGLALLPGSKAYVAIWAAVQRRKKVHPQIVAFYPVPSPQTMEFTALRGGHSFPNPTVPLKDLVGGELRVQMDTVYAAEVGAKKFGGVVSHPSEVESLVITAS